MWNTTLVSAHSLASSSQGLYQTSSSHLVRSQSGGQHTNKNQQSCGIAQADNHRQWYIPGQIPPAEQILFQEGTRQWIGVPRRRRVLWDSEEEP